MINTFMKNGSMKIQVQSDGGKRYTILATVDPRIYGENKPNPEKAKEAEAEGKQYVFNVKANQWQKVRIKMMYIRSEDGLLDEWFTFEIYPKTERKKVVRLSLEEAIKIIEEATGAKVEIVKKRKSKEDPRYIVKNGETATPYSTGFQIVRLAKDLQLG